MILDMVLRIKNVIIELSIRWALMKCHIKLLSMVKTQAFRQDF